MNDAAPKLHIGQNRIINVLGIDPGQEHSGVALLGIHSKEPVYYWGDVIENGRIVSMLRPHYETIDNPDTEDGKEIVPCYQFWWESKTGMASSTFVAPSTVVAIEMMEGRGMPVPQSGLDTCVWIGRFIQASGEHWHLIRRRDVKLQLCGRASAKDPNIVQAVRDFFPAIGGGKDPIKGTKAEPGPLYGIKSHAWQALAVALAWWDKAKENELAAEKVSAG